MSRVPFGTRSSTISCMQLCASCSSSRGTLMMMHGSAHHLEASHLAFEAAIKLMHVQCTTAAVVLHDKRRSRPPCQSLHMACMHAIVNACMQSMPWLTLPFDRMSAMLWARLGFSATISTVSTMAGWCLHYGVPLANQTLVHQLIFTVSIVQNAVIGQFVSTDQGDHMFVKTSLLGKVVFATLRSLTQRHRWPELIPKPIDRF